MSDGQQRIAGYEIGSGSDEADQALRDMSKMFDGRVPDFHRVLANTAAVVTAFESTSRSEFVAKQAFGPCPAYRVGTGSSPR